MKKLILVTGGDGRFSKVLKKNNKNLNLYFASKKECNILDVKSINRLIKKIKPNIIIHCAGLSRPMNIHEKNIELSIQTNIIGTANIVRACKKLKIKLIYFSTNYVYPCKKGRYKETDTLKPINNYAWSKLGGECAVQMLKDSLILRLSMTDYPFAYKTAIKNVYSSFLYNKDFAKILPHLLNEKGVLNIGGVRQTIYAFAKKDNNRIKGIRISKKFKYPLDSSININKFKSILKKKLK